MKTALVILFTLISTSALATTWSEQDTYFVSVQFSSVAFGKPVSSVFAHIGILRQSQCGGGNGSEYWDSVEDVQMNPSSAGFVGKTEIATYTGECQPLILGPVVQYWVTFSDGSSMQTDSVLVSTTTESIGYNSNAEQSYTDAVNQYRQSFQSMPVTQTGAERIEFGYAD